MFFSFKNTVQALKHPSANENLYIPSFKGILKKN